LAADLDDGPRETKQMSRQMLTDVSLKLSHGFVLPPHLLSGHAFPELEQSMELCSLRCGLQSGASLAE
jgi:hypothetical protein